MPAAALMNAAEYLEIPWDGRRSQLIDGVVVMTEAGLPHQRVMLDLAVALHAWANAEAGRGLVSLPLDVGIDERNVYGPDALWFRDGRVPSIDRPRPYPVPDLAVEVRSPSTWRHDLGTKRAGYERAGLPELWLVDTAAAVIHVSRRSSPSAARFDVELELVRGDTLTSPQLPGFALAIAELLPA